MFKNFALVLSLLLSISLSAEEWKSLFDGKTLDGWSTKAKGQIVKVVDGEIHILSKKANLWLLSDLELTDFELEVEALMPKAGSYNSGVGFRCGSGKKPLGYQCEIDGKKSGSCYAIGKGWVYPSKNDWEAFYKIAGESYKEEAWNKFRIRCQGDHIQIWVNDVKTLDLKDTKYQKGKIALQHHGKGDTHRFRNIRYKKL